MEGHKSLYVTDASVLIKWAILEVPNLKEALDLRRDLLQDVIDIKVPAHCLSEVCNLLGRNHNALALSFLSFLITSKLEEYVVTIDLASTALRIMKRYRGISFYDASYHALAIQEKGTFITADEKYYKKTHSEGAIMLLKDYGKRR